MKNYKELYQESEDVLQLVLEAEEVEKLLKFDSEVYFKLQEAEKEADLTEQRYSSKDVLKMMKEVIGRKQCV